MAEKSITTWAKQRALAWATTRRRQENYSPGANSQAVGETWWAKCRKDRLWTSAGLQNGPKNHSPLVLRGSPQRLAEPQLVLGAEPMGAGASSFRVRSGDAHLKCCCGGSREGQFGCSVSTPQPHCLRSTRALSLMGQRCSLGNISNLRQDTWPGTTPVKLQYFRFPFSEN